MQQSMEFVTWKENRDGKWSETTYSGLRTQIDEREILISKLSHGWRVFFIVDRGKYNFLSTEKISKIPFGLLTQARLALTADTEFQIQMEKHNEELLSSLRKNKK